MIRGERVTQTTKKEQKVAHVYREREPLEVNQHFKSGGSFSFKMINPYLKKLTKLVNQPMNLGGWSL